MIIIEQKSSLQHVTLQSEQWQYELCSCQDTQNPSLITLTLEVGVFSLFCWARFGVIVTTHNILRRCTESGRVPHRPSGYPRSRHRSSRRPCSHQPQLQEAQDQRLQFRQDSEHNVSYVRQNAACCVSGRGPGETGGGNSHSHMVRSHTGKYILDQIQKMYHLWLCKPKYALLFRNVLLCFFFVLDDANFCIIADKTKNALTWEKLY